MVTRIVKSFSDFQQEGNQASVELATLDSNLPVVVLATISNVTTAFEHPTASRFQMSIGTATDPFVLSNFYTFDPSATGETPQPMVLAIRESTVAKAYLTLDEGQSCADLTAGEVEFIIACVQNSGS